MTGSEDMNMCAEEATLRTEAASLLAAAQEDRLLDASQDVDAMVALTADLLARTAQAQASAAKLRELRSVLDLSPAPLDPLDQATQEVRVACTVEL